MQVDQALNTTRAVRKRLDLERPVERSVVEECLELALQAPNGSNQQLYRWILIDDPQLKRQAADLYRAGLAGYSSSGPSADKPRTIDYTTPAAQRISASVAHLQEHLQDVPVLVIPVIAGRLESASVFRQASMWGSVLPAVWSFMLALRARGLGSAWTTIHLHQEQEMADLLAIPSGYTQVGLFPVAYSIGTDFKPGLRRPVTDRLGLERLLRRPEGSDRCLSTPPASRPTSPPSPRCSRRAAPRSCGGRGKSTAIRTSTPTTSPRFNDVGKIQYLTEHWNTWHAHNVLFNNFPMEPAHPLGVPPAATHPADRYRRTMADSRYDLLIKSGTIVDGTGAARYVADVAISGGRIVAVGPDLGGAAAEVIDAAGKVVAPGFVDIHTHYDGQATWDPVLEPSASHGVTTVVAGNCGVGFAPVRPGQESWLVELMEGVEDIPGTALHEGIQWDWETFPQYLDALDRREYAMDIAAFLPHAPLRVYVMGQRGADNENATAEDIAEMARHVREAIEAGAVGFSTSRSLNHTSLDGELVPGTFAQADELIGLAQAVVDGGGGLFEVVPTGETGSDAEQILSEVTLMGKVAKETGLPLSFLLVQASGAPELWKQQLALVEQARSEGARLTPQVAARPGGMLLGLTSYHGFMRRPTFRALEDSLPIEQLQAELAKPEVKAAILQESDLPADPKRQFEALTENTPYMFERIYVMGDPPDYEPLPSQSIAGIAAADRQGPVGGALRRDRHRHAAARGVPQLRRGQPRRAAGHDRPSGHRCRAVRRRSPRENDL